jgi:hypothetical protein
MATTSKTVATQDDLNTVVTMRDAVEAALATGLTRDDVEVIVSPYEVLNKDKSPLLNVPFFIRKVAFKKDPETEGGYAVVHLVDANDKLWVMTDGSTGIYTQLVKIVENAGRDHDFFIANGLRKSDYKIPDGPNAGQPATTYYLA